LEFKKTANGTTNFLFVQLTELRKYILLLICRYKSVIRIVFKVNEFMVKNNEYALPQAQKKHH